MMPFFDMPLFARYHMLCFHATLFSDADYGRCFAMPASSFQLLVSSLRHFFD